MARGLIGITAKGEALLERGNQAFLRENKPFPRGLNLDRWNTLKTLQKFGPMTVFDLRDRTARFTTTGRDKAGVAIRSFRRSGVIADK
ncbi:hypothetical protein LCGC14_0585090 [marine sediment metagenome]|uniref:Uncharacterized protein n=1 Tax=marine sediment metagenome TaxID=412755 RepID=A0A0F9RYX6_9ZZZZ